MGNNLRGVGERTVSLQIWDGWLLCIVQHTSRAASTNPLHWILLI